MPSPPPPDKELRTMRTSRFHLLVLAAVAAPFCAPPTHAAPDPCAAKAGAMFDALGRGDYAAATRDMDEHLRSVSMPSMLPRMWEGLTRNGLGAYRSHGEATATRNGDGTTTVSLPATFERTTQSFSVTCDPKKGGAIVEMVLL
jgi:hypothetical protein